MSIYEKLKSYVNGESTPNSVRRSDESGTIDINYHNEKNLGKSVVVLTFTESEYVEMFTDEGRETNNKYLISVAFGGSRGYYHSGVFIDSSYADDDFREGYILRYMNEDNHKLIQKILDMTSPNLNITVTDQYEEIARLLLSIDEDACNQISYEYAEYYDEALVAGLREYVIKQLCNKFHDIHFFEQRCAEKYITTANLLIQFFEEYDIDKQSIDFVECLKQYVSENNLTFDEDLYDDYHAYYDDRNFNHDAFDYSVNRQLEKIYDKLLEDLEEGTLEKNFELINYVKKLGYYFGKTYNFPKEKNFGTKTSQTFRLDKVEDGKIIVVIPGRRMKMNLEDFQNFLFHPELF